MSQKTTEQANVVADAAVAGANEVAQATVDSVENAALSTGFVTVVSHESFWQSWHFISFFPPQKII